MGALFSGIFTGRYPGRPVELLVKWWDVPSSFYLHKSGWMVYKFDKAEDRDHILLGILYFVLVISLFKKYMPRYFLFVKDGQHVLA